MKAAQSLMVVFAVCVASGALGVHVKDGDRSFPLQAVETLKDLMDVGVPVHPRLSRTSISVVCQNPNLPQVFQPVCQEREVALTFSRLVDVLSTRDACEICANPSCFGCLN